MTIDPLKYRTIFLQEAQDQLASYEQALLLLDPDHYDTEAVDTAYRAVHSLKAGADAVGLEEIAKYSHCLERLLDRARDVKTTSAGDLDHLLAGFDVLTAYVRAANDPTFQGPDLQKVLADLEDKPVPKPTPAAKPPASAAKPPAPANVPAAAPVAAPVAPTPPPTLFPVDTGKKFSSKPYTLTLAPENDAYRRGIDPTGMLMEVSKVSSIRSVQLDASRLPSLADLEPEECYLQWKVELETDHADDVLDVFSICGDTLDVRLVSRTTDEPEPTSSEPDDSSSSPTFWVLQPDPTVFLKFLVETNEINALQAMQSLERQRESRPLIGRLAVELQKMKTEQLFKTLSEIREGEKFGDAAIRLGFLDECRMAELLFVQQQTLAPITDCLVELGFIEKQRMKTLVEEFHQLARQSPSEHECYVEQVGFISPAPAVATADLASLEGNQAMIGDFCQEAAEHIAEADKHLLIIDGEPTNAESLNSVYRAFHTIKGVASMLGLTGVQTVAHEAENLLNLARESKVLLRGPFLDLTFESCDAIRRQMEIALKWVNNGGEMAADPKTPPLLQSLKEAVRRVNAGMTDMPAMRESGAEKIAESRVEAEPVVASSGNVAAPIVNTPEYTGPERRKNAAENETVRVSKSRLDELINLIGELVIAHSMAKTEFDELSRQTGAHSRALPELSKIARDIQELSFSLRMIPLQATFQRMSRLVRDLNRKIGKQVELKLEGEETELDKSVVDQLGDPLMHMVRNAIDHGLETPAERLAAGKPETGHLTIRAFHQGGNVHIEIADDGRGLARERILRKAIEKGIVPEGERLTDSEIYALIFAPGFSTAAAVTDVSGRGVGMDVVRRNVESLHGSIHIRTKEGSGTTFTIRLPLTLAIMDGLMVGLGDDVYVLPLLSVVESFRPKPAEIHTVAGRGELVTARGEVIPLIRLHRVLGRPARHTAATSGIVVLVEDQGRRHALFVDELLGQMQAVVKSLDENYCRVEGLAGATILGDGRVAMILDIHGLAKLYAGGHVGPAITESVADAGLDHERTNHHQTEKSLS